MKGNKMSVYMSIMNTVPQRGDITKAGVIAKQQLRQLQFNRSMASIVGHTDKDFFNLQHPPKNVKAGNAIKNFTEGLKNFFEKGTMF